MSVSITNHTTASSPRPHVLYQVNSHINGIASSIYRRYSEFATLHEGLKDPFNLPPKRYLTTTFIPSAWVDDALISERKSGLTEYLNDLLSSQEYEKSQALLDFLTAPEVSTPDFSLEDALPSTLSKKTGATLSTKVSGDVDANATPIAAAYYPGWASGTKSPESIDFSKFDILFFAFATPSSSAGLSFDSGGTSILKRLVTAAHNSGKGTKVVLSIGGWGGCQYFSQSVNSSHRSTFVTACKNAVNTYNLDGIDIDWEYPNSPGAGQPYSSSDSSNLLTFYKNLRTALGSSKIISSAVTHLPYLGSNGSPLKDVSAYAAVMNYVNIMNYDVWGASSTPGPNAPYGNLCGTSKQPQANAQAAISQWTAARFPASKIIMGLPLYGYVSQSSKTVLTGSLMPSSDMLVLQQSSEPPTEIFNELPEDSDRPYIKSPNEIEEISNTDTYFLNGAHPRSKGKNTTAGKVTVQANLQSWYGQQIPFNEIVKAGALSKKSDGTYGEAGGFTMAWDNCSNTPYLYNTSQKTVVTYDDTWSLADKATLAKSKGLAGVMTWSLDQDDGYTLQNAIRKALGK